MLSSRSPVDAELVAEAIPHIVWTAAPDGSTTYFNRRGADYTGHPPETNYGWNWVTHVHPEDADRAREAWEAAVRDGTDYALDYRIRRHDGVYLWHSFRAQPVRDDKGAILVWIGTATDIEDQKQLELSLRRAENEANEALTLLRSIEASTPIGFKLVDRDLRITRVNEMLARTNGLSIEDQLGRPVSEITPGLWPELEQVYERALAGEATANVEISAPSAEDPDRVRYWLGSYYPVRIGGEIIGVGNVVVDITELKEAEATISRNLAALVDTIATTVEYRDPYTAGHQERVAQIATAIAEELGLEADEVDGIRTAASIHDLGKLSIPAEILTKPGVLSSIEMQLIQQHAEAGYRIVSGIDFPWPVADMIRQHHERLDGSGYPLGLRAREILLGARIIAVADIVEAMMAHRPYRPAHGVEAALRQIASDRGTLLDREAVDTCLRLFRSGRLSAEMTIVDARIARRSRNRTDAAPGQVHGPR